MTQQHEYVWSVRVCVCFSFPQSARDVSLREACGWSARLCTYSSTVRFVRTPTRRAASIDLPLCENFNIPTVRHEMTFRLYHGPMSASICHLICFQQARWREGYGRPRRGERLFTACCGCAQASPLCDECVRSFVAHLAISIDT